MHEKSDKLSLIKLNFICRKVFILRRKYVIQVVTFKILEITQMHMICLTLIKKIICHW
jgi:hypothetical protein